MNYNENGSVSNNEYSEIYKNTVTFHVIKSSTNTVVFFVDPSRWSSVFPNTPTLNIHKSIIYQIYILTI